MGIGKFIEDNIPAAHTFGTLHDKFVDYATKELELPDELVNIPSMPAAYGVAVFQEFTNGVVDIYNSVFDTNIDAPFEHSH